jgi:hypothetical protein
MFESKLVEGQVYEISHFTTFPESGLYRTTLHPHKIVFQLKTKLKICDSSDISEFGLSFTNIEEICAHSHDYEYLVGKGYVDLVVVCILYLFGYLIWMILIIIRSGHIFFVDVIGVMTGMSAEKEYLRGGKITRMVIVELTDHR